MSTEKRITLAKIAGAHGVKGLIKIFPLGDDITLIESLDVFTSDGAPIKITLKNQLGKFILAEADIIQTREEAIAAKGTELQVNQSALPQIEDEDEFYYHDLVGLKVLNADNAEIGKVITVDNFGAGDLLEISLKDGKIFLLPFNDDTVTDIGKTTLTIHNFETYIL